jgi:hypothetical protein
VTVATRYSLNLEKRSDLSKLHGVRAVYLGLLCLNDAHLSLFLNALRFQTQSGTAGLLPKAATAGEWIATGGPLASILSLLGLPRTD